LKKDDVVNMIVENNWMPYIASYEKGEHIGNIAGDD